MIGEIFSYLLFDKCDRSPLIYPLIPLRGELILIYATSRDEMECVMATRSRRIRTARSDKLRIYNGRDSGNSPGEIRIDDIDN